MDAVVARPAPPVDDARSVRAQRAEQPLYVNRIKVYPRRVDGFYRRIKWAVLVGCLAVYYLVPWLRWSRGPGAPDQAVLIDLPGRRGYFFAIEIWPQEVYYLTGLLILGGAAGNFFDRVVFGGVRDFLWVYYQNAQTGELDFNYPVFNLADAWLVMGAALLLFQAFFLAPAKPHAGAETPTASSAA